MQREEKEHNLDEKNVEILREVEVLVKTVTVKNVVRRLQPLLEETLHRPAGGCLCRRGFGCHLTRICLADGEVQWRARCRAGQGRAGQAQVAASRIHGR